MHDFQYHLEKNLYELFRDLNAGHYRHGGYKKFVVCDNKRREISVASVRDRVAHRLVYDFLEKIYDKTFIYDAWSCRKGKGLLGAIERTQEFLKRCNTHTHTHNEAIFRGSGSATCVSFLTALIKRFCLKFFYCGFKIVQLSICSKK